MAQPILPRNARSPLAETRRTNKARRRIKKALADTRGWLIQQWREVPVNRFEVNAVRYEYLIDVSFLDRLMAELRQRLNQSLGDAVLAEAIQGYEVGTNTAVTNLSGLTEDYQRTITQVTASQPYLSRVAFLRSRVFEEMQGFEGDTATDLRRVLSQTVEDGDGPDVAATRIRERFGVAQSRAERIARTEITGAQRRGRWDEAQDAQERLGIRTRLMHLSALRSNSRSWHIARHAEIFTIDEVREWYSVDSNAINCQCSQTETLVDEEGNNLYPAAQQRALKAKKRLGY